MVQPTLPGGADWCAGSLDVFEFPDGEYRVAILGWVRL